MRTPEREKTKKRQAILIFSSQLANRTGHIEQSQRICKRRFSFRATYAATFSASRELQVSPFVHVAK
jgi:hypothetical protein